jgi:L-alanine-DL-glutamate epimerase-like enolase superfamily enzyme
MASDDYHGGATWRDEVVTNASAVTVKNGYLAVPKTPGLGVDIDEKAVAKHPSKKRAWRDWNHPETFVIG